MRILNVKNVVFLSSDSALRLQWCKRIHSTVEQKSPAAPSGLIPRRHLISRMPVSRRLPFLWTHRSRSLLWIQVASYTVDISIPSCPKTLSEYCRDSLGSRHRSPAPSEGSRPWFCILLCPSPSRQAHTPTCIRDKFVLWDNSSFAIWCKSCSMHRNIRFLLPSLRLILHICSLAYIEMMSHHTIDPLSVNNSNRPGRHGQPATRFCEFSGMQSLDWHFAGK